MGHRQQQKIREKQKQSLKALQAPNRPFKKEGEEGQEETTRSEVE